MALNDPVDIDDSESEVRIVIDTVGEDPRFFFPDITVGDFLEMMELDPNDVIVTVDGYIVEPTFKLWYTDRLEIEFDGDFEAPDPEEDEHSA